MDESSLRGLLARGVSVEEIGRRFGRDPSTVTYWMRKYGLQPRSSIARGTVGWSSSSTPEAATGVGAAGQRR